MNNTNPEDDQQESAGPLFESSHNDKKLEGGIEGSFDLDALRLGQDFAEQLGVKKALVTVPVRRPPKHTFVRVRAGEEWRLTTRVIEFKEDREVFLVGRDLWDETSAETIPVTLATAIDRQGVLFIWWLRVPDERRNGNTMRSSPSRATPCYNN